MTRLEAARRLRRLNQTQLGALAGLHQPEVSMCERRRMVPTAAQAERLAQVLHVDPAELLDEVDAPDEAQAVSR